jgi:hypothetical protein
MDPSGQDGNPTNINTASLKMNIIVIAPTKEATDKTKSKIYDLKFSKMNTAHPTLDSKKIAKDVHAVVAYATSDEDVRGLSNLLKDFEKY